MVDLGLLDVPFRQDPEPRMRRVPSTPRPDWRSRVESYGLGFHTPDGNPYWDESACYEFSVAEIDTIEEATQTLHDLCLELVDEIIEEGLWAHFDIPVAMHPLIRESWLSESPSIYGRFDLAYDGSTPPKLLEYNADTPTSLLEASVAQWFWLKDIDRDGDQFNSIHERLIDAWKAQRSRLPDRVAFAGLGNLPEDLLTVEYMRDTATQAGINTFFIDIGDIGHDPTTQSFTDSRDGKALASIFKLYPWEWMTRERYGTLIPTASTVWIEPPWKALLSDKAILPLLWQRHRECPYLLPASFDPPDYDHVRKPRLGREGANMQVVRNGRMELATPGPYIGPCVYQAWHPVQRFQGRHPVLGSWVVNNVACGLGIREDDGPITRDTSRFVPHRMTRH